LTEPLQVGQFAIVDGEPVDRGPNAGVFHGRGPSDDRAELFILAEGTTPAGEAFAGHVVSALGQAFASLDMSLTGSLTRLFHEAERNVADWNRKSIAQHRVAIGLTAFGRRGDQAVIAQAGPSAAFHLHAGRMTGYFSEDEHAQALGAAPVQPQLTRIPFDDGDRLLLISTHALGELDDELIAGILALPEEQVLPDLYRRVQQLKQVTVILVTGPHAGRGRAIVAEASADDEYVIGATESEHTNEATFQPSLFIEDEAEAVVLSARAQLMEVMPRQAMDVRVPVMVAEAPAPLLRASGESAMSINRLAAEGAARAARSRAAVATIAAETPRFAQHRPSWRSADDQHVAHAVTNETTEPANGNGIRTRKNQSFSRGLVSNGAAPPRPELLTEDLPLAAEMAAGRRVRASVASPYAETLAAENGAAVGTGTPLIRPRANMGGRWKGNNSFGKRSSIGSQLPPTWMVILGAFAALLIIAGIATVPRMLGDDSGERVAVLLEGAQQRIAAATGQADAGQRRELLTEARAMLLEAQELGETAQSGQLISQVAGAITQMDNVREPQAVEAVASLEQFGAKPVAVARMAVASDSAYLLDVNSAQVVEVPLNGAEPRVVFAENKQEMRAKPIAIAHLDAPGPGLLIADSSNHLYAFSPSAGLRAIPFAAPANLVPADIAVRGRNLYVLDASAQVIYRFGLAGDGFPNAPAKAVQSADLAQARRLAVLGDEFFTTDADGTLHRFINNGSTAITFSQAGIDRRLVAPETAQAINDSSDVAILDAANDRIVVLRRDGGFDRQYRHTSFAGASAFAVRDGVSYVFAGAKLHRVSF